MLTLGSTSLVPLLQRVDDFLVTALLRQLDAACIQSCTGEEKDLDDNLANALSAAGRDSGLKGRELG